MKLNPAQTEAVEHTFGPLLVLAGPGTGKTQLLSTRVVNILETTDTNPENILCLTFTESGAANMRTRLSSLIKRASAKVHIHTYHSFGRTILDAYQYYSQSPPRLFDRPLDNVATYQILSEIQSKLPMSDILKNAKISDLAATIKELKSARLASKDIAKITSTNLDESAGLNSAISPLLNSIIPRKYEPNIKIYHQILEQISKHISTKPIVKNIEPEANFLARSLRQILEEQATAEKPSLAPLTKWRNDHFEKDAAGNYRSKNFISNKKLLSLSQILEKYQTALAAQNLFDYADMIEQAIHYLEKDQGFRLTLQEKYQFILLDEFQDTNPSQFDLVKALTDYEQPNIMAVGDDDQAIMEFQGAQNSNLLDFQNHYNAKIITLTENYRSTQPILDFCRKIADQITDSFSKSHGIDKKLTSSVIATPDSIRGKQSSSITRHQFIAAPSEYHWISAQIADLLEQGTNPSEIAILTPKHKYIPTLLPHLSSKNIPVSYEKRENILKDPRISHLLTLARFIHALAEQRQSSHLLLELLSAPYWGIDSLSVITALSDARISKRNALKYLQDSPDEQLRTLATFFADLATHSFDTPLELFLDYLTGSAPLKDFRSPFLSYYTQSSQTSEISIFTLYENLSILRETVISHSRKETLRLSDIVSMIDAYQTAKEPIVNTSPYQTAEDAVSVLSVHKGKGLEFSHVFLVAVDDSAWGNATGNNNTLTLPKNLAFVRHTGITEDERLRVFFVALSRARTHLYLTSSTQDFAGKNSAPLEYLDEHDGISPLLPEATPKIIIHTEDTPDLAPLVLHWSSSYHNAIPDLSLILKEKLKNYRLTPTDLTTFIDIVYAGPLSFYTQKLLGAPISPPDAKQLYGNFIHATLDYGTKNKQTTDADLLAHFENLVSSADASADEKSALLEQGSAQLPKILGKIGPQLRLPTTLSEINFKSESIVIDGVPITGKIDQLLIDEKTKTITIIDFKTSAYDPKKSFANNPTLFKYRLQLGFYKLLLNNSPTYSKYKVDEAIIEHLSPDVHDELVSRPYTFPPADETEIKDLITAVYQHITTLNFPPIAPDADRNLKDIKQFISTLLAA